MRVGREEESLLPRKRRTTRRFRGAGEKNSTQSAKAKKEELGIVRAGAKGGGGALQFRRGYLFPLRERGGGALTRVDCRVKKEQKSLKRKRGEKGKAVCAAFLSDVKGALGTFLPSLRKRKPFPSVFPWKEERGGDANSGEKKSLPKASAVNGSKIRDYLMLLRFEGEKEGFVVGRNPFRGGEKTIS